MEWILILFLGAPYGGPAAAEFADKPSCEAALAAGKKRWFSFEGICVPKQVSSDGEHK